MTRSMDWQFVSERRELAPVHGNGGTLAWWRVMTFRLRKEGYAGMMTQRELGGDMQEVQEKEHK